MAAGAGGVGLGALKTQFQVGGETVDGTAGDHAAESRNDYPHQERSDANYHQQFDQCKSVVSLIHKSTPSAD